MAARNDSRSLRAKIEGLMAELATYPTTGGTAWQFREGRRRLAAEIENVWQAYDIAREVEGDATSFFDQDADA